MKIKIRFEILLLLTAVAIAGYLYSQINNYQELSDNSPCIPAFADGGGPYYIENVPSRHMLAPKNAKGQTLIIKGRVLKQDCKTPIAGVVLNIWHADAAGNYQNDWYRGKITSKGDGQYYVETIIPKGYGQGTAFRPPHIHFKVFVNNQEIITSQMFFPDVKGKTGFGDGYIMRVEEKEIRGEKILYANHDIILPL